MKKSDRPKLDELVGSPLKEIEEEFISVAAMQNQIMPDPHVMTVFGRFDVYGRTIPTAIVGGDFFDFIEMEERFGIPDRLGLVIADASGHGLSAAMLVRDFNTALYTALEFQTYYEKETSPMFLEKINRRMFQSSLPNQFISAFYGELTLEGRLRYINAGHLPPLRFRQEQVRKLDTGGPVLGAFRELPKAYQVGEVWLRPGDLLLAYTDGFTEAMSPEAGQEFGMERLISTIQDHRNSDPQALFQRVMETVSDFTGHRQDDDQTLLILSLPGA